MPRHGHGGGHHGGHGGHGHHRGGRGVGPWYGGYPYPASPDVFFVDDESDLDRRLKEVELLERMKRLTAGQKAISGFDMPSTTTLLLGAAALGAVYLLTRKRR